MAIHASVSRHCTRAYLLVGIVIGVYALILLASAQLLNDPDSHWHLHVGREILATGSFPKTDSYSHSFVGQRWIAKEWLSQVLIAAAHAIGGWLAVTALVAAATAAALAILAGFLLPRVSPLSAVALLGFALLCMVPHLLARPHVLALPVMVAWFVALFRAVEEGDGPPWAAAGLMCLWSNLHGSFTFGLAFGGLVAAEALLTAAPGRRLRALAVWGAFGLVSLAAACVHPYGVESLVAAARVLNLGEAKAVIGEWRPHDFASFSLFQALLLGGLAALVLSGLRLPLYRTILLVLLVHLTLSHQRHLTLLGILAPLILAPALAVDRATSPAMRRGWIRPAAVGVVGWLGVTGLAVALGYDPRPEPRWMPEAALSAAREAGVSGQVLNDYNFGGFLIARGVPTYVDGRTELFGGRFVAGVVDAMKLDDLDRFHALLDDPRIGWTLLAPSRAAVAYLDRIPGWRRIHADAIAVVHARDPRASPRGEAGQ